MSLSIYSYIISAHDPHQVHTIPIDFRRAQQASDSDHPFCLVWHGWCLWALSIFKVHEWGDWVGAYNLPIGNETLTFTWTVRGVETKQLNSFQRLEKHDTVVVEITWRNNIHMATREAPIIYCFLLWSIWQMAGSLDQKMARNKHTGKHGECEWGIPTARLSRSVENFTQQ